MAGIKISDLPAAPSALLTDIIPADQGAVTYKETLQQVLTLFESNIVVTPANFTGVLPLSKGGTEAILTANNGGIVYSNASTFAILAGTPTAGQIIRSGASSAPSWSTATYPATAGAIGNVLTSDGTNWVSSAPTGGNPLTTKGDLFTFTTVDARLPVGATNGQILQVNSATATGLAWSTATFPSTATNVARILRSDGTNWVETTSTFADTYTASSILYANGANNVAGLTTANNGVLVTSNTGVPSLLAGPGATGRVLTSNTAAAPSWSTATFPVTGGTAGNILISDGTNYIASTSLWPNTVGTSGKVVISNGTSNVYSTPTYPNAATTTGSFIYADGTNFVASTSLWPNTVGTAGKIIRSDGTTNAYTTSTFADTYAVSTLLYASSANVVTGLATANSAYLITNSSGVPSWSTSKPITQINTQTITTTGAFTYTPTSGTQYAVFKLQAGGGASGGSTGAGGQSATSGAGGGGGYLEILVVGTTNLAAISGSVGVGGTAGTAGNNAGGAGGNTTLVVNSGTTWTATGGSGGGGQTSSASSQASGTVGAGGNNTTGTNATLILNIPGQTGNAGFSNGSTTTLISVGKGGDSQLGRGGYSPSDGTASAGFNYGGGAAGRYNGTGGSLAGAAGAQGVVTITEYISI